MIVWSRITDILDVCVFAHLWISTDVYKFKTFCIDINTSVISSIIFVFSIMHRRVDSYWKLGGFCSCFACFSANLTCCWILQYVVGWPCSFFFHLYQGNGSKQEQEGDSSCTWHSHSDCALTDGWVNLPRLWLNSLQAKSKFWVAHCLRSHLPMTLPCL